MRLKVAYVLRELRRPHEAIAMYHGAARSFAQLGRLVQAIAVCRTILELDSAHRETQEMLAELVEQQQRKRRPTPALRMQQVDGRWIAIPVADERVITGVRTGRMPE